MTVTRHTAHGYWLEEADRAEMAPPLAEDRAADVVVVGGGYTGMWTAWLLGELEPEARIVVVEGARCGDGPSGRNGGFVNAMWFSLPTLRGRFGDDQAIAIARASQEAVDAIGAWCREEDVDAWFTQGGYMQVSTAPATDGAWEEAVRACAELGEPNACRPLSAVEVRARCHSPCFRAGALYPGAATVQPARLGEGLRTRLARRGVEVFEGSPVRRIEVRRSGVRVATPRGNVSAASVVLATGGALAGLRPLRNRLTVTSSHMVITEPVPDLLEEIGWTAGECITDSRALIHYLRTTPDGRIAFGWGGGRVAPGARVGGRAEIDPDVVGAVRRDLLRFLPGLQGRRIEQAWGGPIDVSPTHLPVIGTLGGERAHYAFGYTGNGVGPSRMVGRILASLALDRCDEATRLALVEPPPLRVPPEPLRYIGGTIVRAALLRKEAAEEEGRAANRLTSFVAGIPDRIGIQIGR
jgi:glycine/D-amino acid oxidase-like deaminating enzyme